MGEFPHRHFYPHATNHLRALADQLTRYHKFDQLIADTYWFPPAHEHVRSGETITLQCDTVISHLWNIYAPDLVYYLRYYNIVPSTYVVLFSLMDTATLNNGALVIPPLRSGDF